MIGSLALGGVHDYGVTAAVQVPQIAIGLSVAGVVVILLAILGMIGTFRELKVLLGIFFALLLLITIVELGMGMAAYTVVDVDSISTETAKTWPKMSTSVHNLVQEKFVCCGLYGTPDTTSVCPPLGISHGCLAPFSTWLASKVETINIVAIVSAVVQVLILIFTFLLFQAARSGHNEESVPLLAPYRLIHVH